MIAPLRNKIVVSVQAEGNEPLNTPECLLALSQSVINGGAGALRLCGVKNINHIKKEVPVPIIGLTKLQPTPINWLDKVYITPTMKDVKDLLKTEVGFIALDGTNRPRQDDSTLEDQIALVKNEGKIVICDVSNLDDGLHAVELGATILSTTLSGYTKDTRYKVNIGPDFDLLAELIQNTRTPVIMEGRIWQPQEVKQAFEIGAYAVVIGTSITRPQVITKRFINAIPINKEV